jgi:hypothetical protein
MLIMWFCKEELGVELVDRPLIKSKPIILLVTCLKMGTLSVQKGRFTIS